MDDETTMEEMAEYEAMARAAGWDFYVSRFTGQPWFSHPEKGLINYENWEDVCISEGL